MTPKARTSLLCLLSAAYCLIFLAFSYSTTANTVHATSASESNLLEIGSASKLRLPIATPSEIKVVSYNIRWRGGDDLRKLIGLLRDDVEIGGAVVIGLQEVDRNKKRTGNTNTARVIAEGLGMNYAWAAPPPTEVQQQEEETGITILTPCPMTDVERIVLPNAGPNGRRRVALGATIQLGATDVRIYALHAETRIPIEQKIEQQRAVLDALAHRPQIQRALILGDFNTWEPRAVRETSRLFKDAGFATPFPDESPTWKGYLIIQLKLDWIWLRGLQAIASGITERITLSDHWPLWVKIKFNV